MLEYLRAEVSEKQHEIFEMQRTIADLKANMA
jgi:hypothetical protein